MRRRGNENPPTPPGITVDFNMPERRRLRPHYRTKGGYQDLVNWIIDNTDADGRCHFDPIHFDRTVRGVQRYGRGGPQERLRDACIPAFSRVGIVLTRPAKQR